MPKVYHFDMAEKRRISIALERIASERGRSEL